MAEAEPEPVAEPEPDDEPEPEAELEGDGDAENVADPDPDADPDADDEASGVDDDASFLLRARGEGASLGGLLLPLPSASAPCLARLLTGRRPAFAGAFLDGDGSEAASGRSVASPCPAHALR